jgi:hypothetical protein
MQAYIPLSEQVIYYAVQKGYSFQLIANENRKAFNQTRKIDPWG